MRSSGTAAEAAYYPLGFDAQSAGTHAHVADATDSGDWESWSHLQDDVKDDARSHSDYQVSAWAKGKRRTGPAEKYAKVGGLDRDNGGAGGLNATPAVTHAVTHAVKAEPGAAIEPATDRCDPT